MKQPKFKKGDQVVMHSCPEAEKPENKGIIFTCEKDNLIYKNAPGELAFLEGYGSINARYLVIVYSDRKRENSPFEMRELEVRDSKVTEVVSELSRRGIMFIQTKSKDEGYQMIYFKAASEVMSYIIYEIL